MLPLIRALSGPHFIECELQYIVTNLSHLLSAIIAAVNGSSVHIFRILNIFIAPTEMRIYEIFTCFC